MRSLTLTPFEESLYTDDWPAYPWNILFRLRFAGELRRDRWEQAVAAVQLRHPLLRAKVRRGLFGRFHWTWPADPAERTDIAVHWNEHAPGASPPLQRLTLEEGATFETWAAVAGGRSEFVFHFHHAVVDGIGAARAIADMLIAYDAAVRGIAPEWNELDPRRLAHRGKYGYNLGKLIRQAKKLSVGLAGVRQFLGREPVIAVPHEPVERMQKLPVGFPSLRAHAFSVDESQAVLKAARAGGTTVNNLLARDLFLALHTWRERLGLGDTNSDQWIRLTVPMSMRSPQDDATPAANITTMVFLDRNAAQVTGDAATLLRGVHDEMEVIKTNDLGMIFLLSLRLTALIPGMLARTSRKQQFACTAGLSNLVRPLETLPLEQADGRFTVGDARLDDFEFYPPLRPRICVSIGIVTYAGRLRVCLQTDPRFISEADATALLSTYAAQIAGSAGLSSPEQ
ncbi:MAG: DUF1298 domain-containing protein [Planctomycetes bacterium]|nr:DUF1298 domain-containing protein [Planctomycetota bacterium]